MASNPSSLDRYPNWKLEDAKARLSEVVRLAREQAPQRITVRGEDAVVIISAQEFAKLLPLLEQPRACHQSVAFDKVESVDPAKRSCETR